MGYNPATSVSVNTDIGSRGNIILYSTHESSRIIISDNVNIYFVDNILKRIIYLSFSEKGLFSVYGNGSGKIKLYGGKVYSAYFYVDGYVYFCPGSKSIRRIMPDGRDSEHVLSFKGTGYIISIEKGIITYADDCIIKKAKTNGKPVPENHLRQFLTKLTGSNRIYKKLMQDGFITSQDLTCNNLIKILHLVADMMPPLADACESTALILDILIACGIGENEEISEILKRIYKHAPLYKGAFTLSYAVKLGYSLLEIKKNHPNTFRQYLKYTSNDLTHSCKKFFTSIPPCC